MLYCRIYIYITCRIEGFKEYDRKSFIPKVLEQFEIRITVLNFLKHLVI